MAFTNGIFARLYSWVSDRDNGIKIRADRMDDEFDGIKDALNEITAGTVQMIGAIKGYDGTVSAPGYGFNSDTNTGVYRIGADNLGLALGGVKHGDFATTGSGLLLKGAPTAGGTADALTVTWPIVASALASEQVITFKAASTNTGAATLNLNSLGAKAVRKMAGGSDVALVAGDLIAGRRYTAIYDSTANSSNGAWILSNVSWTPKGADVASAATITLTQNYHHITGTTTITDIDFTDAVDGRWAWLVFDGALTLTHNSTTLKLPGGANITTEAGDRALIVQDSGDNVICLQYVRAAAVPVTYGTWTPTLTFGGAAVGMTYTTQTGLYVKVGPLVFIDMLIVLSAKGSSTGNASISGLPFTNQSGVQTGLSVSNYASMASMTSPGAYVASSDTTITPFNFGATSNTVLTHANFGGTATFRLAGCYRASA